MGNYITAASLEQRLTKDRLDKLCKVTDIEPLNPIVGALTAAKSGAATSILADGFEATPKPSGYLVLEAAGGHSEEVAYSSYTLNSTVYTFVVSKTLSYIYADNDKCTACDSVSAEKTALIAEIIAQVEAVVDGYLSAEYTTPVTVNDLVVGWCLSIAEYELYKRGLGGDVPAKIRKGYEDAIAQLKDVSKGVMALPPVAAPSPANAAGNSISMTANESVFDEDSFGDW